MTDGDQPDPVTAVGDQPAVAVAGDQPGPAAPAVDQPGCAEIRVRPPAQFRAEHRTAPPATRGWWHRISEMARYVAPAIIAYATVRLVGLGLLWLWARGRGASLLHELGGRADSVWYVGIADRGYDDAVPMAPDGSSVPSNLAFFPLYPALIRIVAALTPLPSMTAGLVVSSLAALVAAWGIFLIGDHLHGRRVGVLLVVLWGVLPHAIVESMAYTEAVVTAFAAFSLYSLLTGRWIAAGVLCSLAGLARPTALALVAAVIVGAVSALRRRHGCRPLFAAVIAPLGWFGYVAWVGTRLGRIDGYFHVQGIWGASFDGGGYTLRSLYRVLTHGRVPIVLYVVTAVLVFGAVLLLVAHRQPAPVWVYSAATFFITVTASGYYHAKGRFMLPAFTLLLPLATGMARMRARTLAVTLAVLACASAWFGAFLRMVWDWSP